MAATAHDDSLLKSLQKNSAASSLESSLDPPSPQNKKQPPIGTSKVEEKKGPKSKSIGHYMLGSASSHHRPHSGRRYIWKGQTGHSHPHRREGRRGSEYIGGGEDLIKGPNQGCGGRGTSDSLNPHFETSTPPLHHPALRNNRDP